MKNAVLFYALLAVGVIVLAAGAYMRLGANFHGKAYAVLTVGAVLLIAGIIGMFMGKSSTKTA